MAIWDYLTSIWEWLNSHMDNIVQAVTSIDVLISNIDGVTFDINQSESIFNKLFGLLRYLMGDTFYLAFMGTVYAAALFMLYKLLMRLWDVARSALKIDLGSIVTK